MHPRLHSSESAETSEAEKGRQSMLPSGGFAGLSQQPSMRVRHYHVPFDLLAQDQQRISATPFTEILLA